VGVVDQRNLPLTHSINVTDVNFPRPVVGEAGIRTIDPDILAQFLSGLTYLQQAIKCTCNKLDAIEKSLQKKSSNLSHLVQNYDICNNLVMAESTFLLEKNE